jgi:hypothetical protein
MTVLAGLYLLAGCVSPGTQPDSYPFAGQSPDHVCRDMTTNGMGWIVIDPVGDKHTGEYFLLTAKTNLSAGTDVTVQTWPLSYNPVNRSDASGGVGAGFLTRVMKGNDGENVITGVIDSRKFRPEPYFIVVFNDSASVSACTWYNVSIAPEENPTISPSRSFNESGIIMNGNSSGFRIAIEPVPDTRLGDIITFHGTTNLPAGENFTLGIVTASFCPNQKIIYPCKNPDTVNAICCSGGFNRTVAIFPDHGGINTWSFTVNTSEYDFRPGQYVVSAESGKTYGVQLFTILEQSNFSVLWISADPLPPPCPGDTITFHGTTNLPVGESITTRIFKARYKCTQCPRKNDSVDGCCGDQIPLSVMVKPGDRGINTWSREVNTSAYDFSAGDYQIDIGEPSRGIWNSSGFAILETPDPSRPWIAIDPTPHHYLGDTITFQGRTNLAPGETITTAVYSAEFAPCPKSFGNCRDNVTPCCGGYSDIVSVLAGTCGINTWSWDVRTAEHGFRPDGEYLITASGRNSAVENTSLFTVSGLPRSNLTLNLPVNDPDGNALRFSGQVNTGNGPEEILLLTVSSDSGKKVSSTVPVYRNGTGYSWNVSLKKSDIVPYNFLSVNVSSATRPEISIQRTFLYNNEPVYYPYNPYGP